MSIKYPSVLGDNLQLQHGTKCRQMCWCHSLRLNRDKTEKSMKNGQQILFTFCCPILMVSNAVQFKTVVGGSKFVIHVEYRCFASCFIFNTPVEILRYVAGQLIGVENSVSR